MLEERVMLAPPVVNDLKVRGSLAEPSLTVLVRAVGRVVLLSPIL